ncbi:hypothetical protein SUGI_0771760 [Cryptomeria japonica]|nr:hypothetical protein SUGI_0771760 [Cryptomeria japonica]
MKKKRSNNQPNLGNGDSGTLRERISMQGKGKHMDLKRPTATKLSLAHDTSVKVGDINGGKNLGNLGNLGNPGPGLKWKVDLLIVKSQFRDGDFYVKEMICRTEA